MFFRLHPLFPFLCLANPCPNQRLVQTSTALAPLLCWVSSKASREVAVFSTHPRFIGVLPVSRPEQCSLCVCGLLQCTQDHHQLWLSREFLGVKGQKGVDAWSSQVWVGRGTGPLEVGALPPFRGAAPHPVPAAAVPELTPGTRLVAFLQPHCHSGSWKSALVGVLTPDHDSVFSPCGASPYHWLQLTTLALLDKWSLDFYVKFLDIYNSIWGHQEFPCQEGTNKYVASVCFLV